MHNELSNGVQITQADVIEVTDPMFTEMDISWEDDLMFSLLHFMYLLAIFYLALVIYILRFAFRPSCRTCLNRQSCPNRLRGADRFRLLPVCIRQGKPRINLAHFSCQRMGSETDACLKNETS